MAILINDNYSLQAQNKAFDARYFDGSTPWASSAAAIAGIPTYRYQGLTINIAGEEWWWKDGTGDGDLIQKALGGTSNLSGATNGLQLLCADTHVGLGGLLTQDTIICGNYGLGLGDIASGLTSISAVTPTFQVYDCGINSNLSFCHDQDTPHFDVCLYGENSNSNADIILDVDNTNGCFVAGTAPNTTCCSSLSLKTTDSDVAIYNVHSTNANMHYINEACIASTKLSCNALIDTTNAALNIKSVMNYDTRSFEFCADNTNILTILSGGTARYGVATTAACITNNADLTNKIYVDEAVDNIGAENGLCKSGDNIVLGGTLTGHTTISGGSKILCLGTAASRLSNLCVQTSNEVCLHAETNVKINAQNCLQLNYGGGFKQIEIDATDMLVSDGTCFKGLIYAGDYETNFVPRSLVTCQYVDSITSGITCAITSASNGLCKVGQEVVLGGSLTGNTTIDGDNNVMDITNLNGYNTISVSAVTCATTSMLLRSPSFTVHNGVDEVMNISATCKKLIDNDNNVGFVYDANYCGAAKTNPRWIPDNAYVTGLTSQALTTASNGLCENGEEVKLGGTLTEVTNICLGGGGTTNTFSIENSGITTCACLDVSPTQIQILASNVNSPFHEARIAATYDSISLCNGVTDCCSIMNMTNSMVDFTMCGGTSNAHFCVTDNTTNPKGIQYGGCYHNTYNDRSLVDKEYVISQVSGITDSAITGATNGLCKIGQDVYLGGILGQDTVINLSGESLCFDGNDNCLRLLQGGRNDLVSKLSNGDYSATLCGSAGTSWGYYRLCANNGSTGEGSDIWSCNNRVMLQYTNTVGCRQIIQMRNDGMLITDLINNRGLEYVANYEANWNNCSLITKEYVDNCVDGVGGANGLCKDGDNIVLGGVLTGDTVITGANNSLTFGTPLSQISEFNVVGTCLIAGNGSNVIVEINETPSIVLESSDGTNYTNFNLCGSETKFDIASYNANCKTLLNLNSNAVDAGYCLMVQNDIGYLRNFGGLQSNNQYMINQIYIDASDNMSTCIENFHKRFTHIIDNKVVLSICSGGTARYGSSVGAVGITDDSDLTNKCYVDTCVNSLTGTTSQSITGATNGLCKIGQNVILGGALSGDTTIDGGHVLNINTTTFNVSATTSLHNVSDGDINSDEVLVLTSGGEIKKITGTSLNVTANNGLTATNNNVKLGGVLSETTTICGGTQSLSFGSSASNLNQFNVYMSSALIQGSTINMNGLTSGIYKGGNFCMQYDNTNATFKDNSTGKDGLQYADCISTGFTSNCSLVDKGYVDSIKLNVIDVCNPPVGEYSATTSNDFIGASGGSTILLPTTSVCTGQKITIADIEGEALSNNIQVCSCTGYCILDTDTATINTNYGSLSFVFNGVFWSTVAFIN